MEPGEDLEIVACGEIQSAAPGSAAGASSSGSHSTVPTSANAHAPPTAAVTAAAAAAEDTRVVNIPIAPRLQGVLKFMDGVTEFAKRRDLRWFAMSDFFASWPVAQVAEVIKRRRDWMATLRTPDATVVAAAAASIAKEQASSSASAAALASTSSVSARADD